MLCPNSTVRSSSSPAVPWPHPRGLIAMMDGLQISLLRSPETIDLVKEWEAAVEAFFAHHS